MILESMTVKVDTDSEPLVLSRQFIEEPESKVVKNPKLEVEEP